ncbi:MAG: ABC transporter permease [Acidimicrobiaceae bacterium]|nr:ABC transporter permease [Acidimicrobiaceae bacterium]
MSVDTPTQPSATGDNARPAGPRAASLRRRRTRPARRRRFSRKTYVGFGLLAFFILMAIFGPIAAPYDPSAAVGPSLVGPSSAHLLGTTQNSQDVLSQLLVGARTTLLVGFLAGLIATALSIVFGVTAGYLGGWGDESLSLVANLFLVIPALPLLIVLTSYLPGAGPLTTAVVISATGWAWGARVLRAQTLSIRNRDYIVAAKISGERTWRIVLFEILPNEAAVVASSFLFTVLFAILTQVALDFLGLVNVSGSWTWGTMLYWAQNDQALSVGAWWWFVPPGLAVALVGTGLALANFGLDELIDPRLRSAGLTRRSDAKLVRQGFTVVHRRPDAAATAHAPTGGGFTEVRLRANGNGRSEPVAATIGGAPEADAHLASQAADSAEVDTQAGAGNPTGVRADAVPQRQRDDAASEGRLG